MDVQSRFAELIAELTVEIRDRSLGPDLGDHLMDAYPPDGAWFGEVERLCALGRDQGWLCAREQDGIRFGRAIKPGPSSHGFSVDVVEMADVVGPHHAHPNGEIDMVMSVDPETTFDGTRRGWKVYGPGSAHQPTVRGGRALVLYLLPGGAIDFTRSADH